MLAGHTANFEKVGKIRRKSDVDLNGAVLCVEIAHCYPLIDGASPQEAGAPQMDQVMLNRETTVFIEKIRIGQVARQHGIVIAHSGAE